MSDASDIEIHAIYVSQYQKSNFEYLDSDNTKCRDL